MKRKVRISGDREARDIAILLICLILSMAFVAWAFPIVYGWFQ